MNIITSRFPKVPLPVTSFSKFVLGRVAQYPPHKPAYIDGSTRKILTFSQFLEKVEVLQRVLYHKFRVKPGDTVAIYALNSLDYPVLVHAFQALGAIVTLESPRCSTEQIRAHLLHSGAQYVVIDKEFTNSLPRGLDQLRGVFSSDLSHSGDASALQPILEDHLPYADLPMPEFPVNPMEDITMLLYSSGTTGNPKGACLTHYNLVSNMQQTDKTVINPLLGGPSIINLALLPFHFIYGTMLMNHTLYSGQTSVVLNHFWLKSMLRTVSELNVTYAGLTPPILHSLAMSPIVEKYPVKLTHIGTGGSSLNTYMAEKVEARLGCKVLQGYGMTEASPAIFQPAGDAPTKHLSVGFPLPHTEVRIFDKKTQMDVKEPNTWGSLLVRGPQVMKRYHNNEVATRRVLSDDGWLATGDVAYFDEEGYFYIVDREQDMIRLRGETLISPSELERIIQQHPGVCDVAVVSSYDSNREEVPKAFVVLSDDDESVQSPNDILEFLNDKVPEHKRLHSIEILSVLPRSRTGKVRRQELAELERTAAGLQE